MLSETRFERMAKWIHIAGSAHRSGTSLLSALMTGCFNIDSNARNEQSILKKPPDQAFSVRLTKKMEMPYLTRFLEICPDLWLIFLLRDPRDAIVSLHRAYPDLYFSNLWQWRENVRAAGLLKDHPRFIWLRYEDLVSDPDSVQAQLMERMPFLEKKYLFSEHGRGPASPTPSRAVKKHSQPIFASSIGNWRRYKPRVLAQMQIHGPLARELIDLGYEKDDAWLMELDGVVANNGKSKRYHGSRSSDIPSLSYRIKQAYHRWRYPRIFARNIAAMRKRGLLNNHAGQ